MCSSDLVLKTSSFPYFGEILDADGHMYMTPDVLKDITKEVGAGPNLWFYEEQFAGEEYKRDRERNRDQLWSIKGLPALGAYDPAERVDYSLHRLSHYTATSVQHFQRFVLFTNYQRYVEEFRAYARAQVETGNEYVAFVEPGDVLLPNRRLSKAEPSGKPVPHLPQLPAYHLVRPDRNGITLIDIGVGPSNAKTITDHVAVLRPHCWMMLGHCAGLRRSQYLGDYVLAHAYVREDHVLDRDIPSFVPIPAIAEIQVALQDAVSKITGLTGADLKTRMRTGTVYTTDNRNWELRYGELYTKLNQSRAIAVDMESATLAANGYRFRVPYGTLLCVSDKPLHGEIKLREIGRAHV